MTILTLIVKTPKYVILGDTEGRLTALPLDEIAGLELGTAEVVPCPPLDAPMIGHYRLTIRPDLPPDAIIKFRYVFEPISNVTVYVGFFKGLWLIRELRGENGKPTGKYYREGSR